ncbi:MAG: RagB/SusD family nutrient uptake outer membrane protein [Paramuribaculum sp.]|nr:RagB/SusD family nutrient uptake outer membrane protein [Paramuribaculum sp.]
MKKILFSVLAAGMMLTSCNMDLDEPGTTPDTEAIQTVQDVRKFRDNLYSNFRALNAGAYVTCTEMQSDFFVGLLGNGGRGSTWTQSDLTSATSDIAGPYASCYGVIANINFMLPYAEALEGQVSGDDAIQLNRYIGEAHFMRAFMYYWLLDHYCGRYEPSALGLQITTKYDPSIPNSEYPGRSNMKTSVDFINGELVEAMRRIKAFEQVDVSCLAANAPYISSFVIEALQARIALLTRDYETAINKANSIITSGVYELANITDYPSMWANDQGSELLMTCAADAQEAAYFGSFFGEFNYIPDYPNRADCVPTWNLLSLYDDVNDVRFNTFFLGMPMTIDSRSAFGFIFNKFPGNPILISGDNEYKNIPKPFRLSEIYLILAEASYEMGRRDAVAALNTLRENRILNYVPETGLAGLALRDAIREERAKELVGEGFRMSDLRRWQMDMRRDASYPTIPGYENLATVFNNADVATVLVANQSPYYVWPIPRNEFEVCPAMKGQQNPGY